MKKQCKPFVIECLSREHGQEMKEFFNESGIETGGYKFNITKDSNDPGRYYGPNERGVLDNLAWGDVTERNVPVLTIEEAKKFIAGPDLSTLQVSRDTLITLLDLTTCPTYTKAIQELLEPLKYSKGSETITVPVSAIELLVDKGGIGLIKEVQRVLGIENIREFIKPDKNYLIDYYNCDVKERAEALERIETLFKGVTLVNGYAGREGIPSSLRGRALLLPTGSTVVVTETGLGVTVVFLGPGSK